MALDYLSDIGDVKQKQHITQFKSLDYIHVVEFIEAHYSNRRWVNKSKPSVANIIQSVSTTSVPTYIKWRIEQILFCFFLFRYGKLTWLIAELLRLLL